MHEMVGSTTIGDWERRRQSPRDYRCPAQDEVKIGLLGQAYDQTKDATLCLFLRVEKALPSVGRGLPWIGQAEGVWKALSSH